MLIFPAGNSGNELKQYPVDCEVPNSVTVAAVDSQGDLAPYSNFGFPAVHLAAPGENIWRISRDGSTQRNGQGSSFSSAFATAVVGLVWSAQPEYSAAQVKTALIRGATERASLRGKVLANGALHARRAIAADISRLE